MAENTVRVDGWPVASGTAAAFARLKTAFESTFPGVTLHVYSGYRSYADQEKIFRDRYRAGAYSPFGDYRWWNGVRWGRVSGEGTVAQPGTSNHGNGRALDIRDSGADAGVTIAGNARSNWIRANAVRYGFDPAGYGFGEPWHIELVASLDPWAGETNQGAAAPAEQEEEDMTPDQDKTLTAAFNNAKSALAEISTTKVAVGRIESKLTEVTEDADLAARASKHALAEIKTTKVAVGGMVKVLAQLAKAQGVDASAVVAEVDAALAADED